MFRKLIVLLIAVAFLGIVTPYTAQAGPTYACFHNASVGHYDGGSYVRGTGDLSCSGPVANMKVNARVQYYIGGVWRTIVGTQGSNSMSSGSGHITALSHKLNCLNQHTWSFRTRSYASWDIIGGGSVTNHRQDSGYITVKCGF